MELIQSSFQASFNARIERLAEQETNELRTIFRYFDTDNDGAVSADQAFRIFGLLGLDVNPVFVRELGEVYLAEFLKIVDSNTPLPVEAAPTEVLTAHTRASSVVPPLPTSSTSQSGASAVDPPVLDEEALQMQKKKQWEEEWRTIDSYRRGYITRDELHSFLKSCFSQFPVDDLERFLDVYSDPSLPEDAMALTKTAFFKFRDDYTNRNLAKSEDGSLVEEEEEEEGEGGQQEVEVTEQPVATDKGSSAPENSEGGGVSVMKRRHSNSISHVQGEGEVDEIVIDAGVLEDDFVEEDDLGEEQPTAHSDVDEAGDLPVDSFDASDAIDEEAVNE